MEDSLLKGVSRWAAAVAGGLMILSACTDVSRTDGDSGDQATTQSSRSAHHGVDSDESAWQPWSESLKDRDDLTKIASGDLRAGQGDFTLPSAHPDRPRPSWWAVRCTGGGSLAVGGTKDVPYLDVPCDGVVMRVQLAGKEGSSIRVRASGQSWEAMAISPE